MLALTWEPPRLRHGPGHVLEWQRAEYRLEKNGEVICEATSDVVGDGDGVLKRFVIDEFVDVTVRELAPTADEAGTGHAVSSGDKWRE